VTARIGLGEFPSGQVVGVAGCGGVGCSERHGFAGESVRSRARRGRSDCEQSEF
jgi:hypothetical protein